MKIPIVEAETLANKYGYNQIIILALKDHKKKDWFGGWRTTFNKDKAKCEFLGKIAHILAYSFRSYYGDKIVTQEHYEKALDMEFKVKELK